MIEYLAELKLTLNENKCRIYSTGKGVPFLGMIIFPTHRRLKHQTLIRFKRRMKKFQKDYKAHKIPWECIRQSFQSWNGHAGHANTWRLRELVLEDIVF